MTKRKANPLSRTECARLAGLASAKSPNRFTPFVRGHEYRAKNRYVFTREDCVKGGKASTHGTLKESRAKLWERMRR